MRRPRLKVVFPRRLAEGFKRRAKAAKVEIFGVLLGTCRGDNHYEIEDIVYPEPGEVLSATKRHIVVSAALFERAAGLGTVLGDIHNHPADYDPAPSDCDWSNHSQYPLMAICDLRRNRAGVLCARIKFYPQLPIVDVRVA